MDGYKRESWIDNSKGIGLIFIIFGHAVSCPDFLINYFFSFHVPMFFFIAGVNFKRELLDDFYVFLKKRCKRLLVPYLFFNFLTYAFWILNVKIFNRPQEVPIIKPLLGIFYGNGHDKWLIHNEPLWFLICLLITQLLFFFILKVFKTKLKILFILFFCATLGYLDSIYLKIRLPLSIDVAITAIVFLGLGYILKEHIETLKRVNLLFLFLMASVNIFIVYLNGKVDMNYNRYNNIFLFYIGAFSGIFFWIGISMKVGRLKILNYIGNNSLSIFALHIPFFIIITKLLILIKIPYYKQVNNVIFMFIHTALIIIAILPLNYIFNRYLPFFIGNKK